MRLDRELKDAAEGDERSCADPVRVEHVPLEVISGLGQGGYAVVVLVRSTNAENHGNPDFFAMKVIEKSKVAKKRSISRLKMELRAMTELPPSRFLQRCHENISQCVKGIMKDSFITALLTHYYQTAKAEER